MTDPAPPRNPIRAFEETGERSIANDPDRIWHFRNASRPYGSVETLLGSASYRTEPLISGRCPHARVTKTRPSPNHVSPWLSPPGPARVIAVRESHLSS